MITINTQDYGVAKQICKGTNCKVDYIHGMGVDTHKYATSTCSREKMRELLDIPQEATVLVSVSEINKNKNLKTTLKALSRINKQNLYYVICGVGEELNNNMILANRLGLWDRVKFLGYRHDINNILHASDIFLFPSIREGLGMAPIEAMSAGLPIIASDIRGVQEYAVNKYNSILLNPMDVAGFSKAIKLLSENRKLREKLGINARKSVKDFDIECSKDAFTSIFNRCCKPKAD